MAKRIISRRQLAHTIRSAGEPVCRAEALERRMLLAANPYQWPLGPETRVNTYTPDSQFAPAIAMDADGNYVVAWCSYSYGYGQDGSYGGIYAQRYDAAGVPRGSEFRANTTTAFNQSAPAVAMDPDGDFVVAWNGGAPNYEVCAQRYNAAGEPQGTEFVVNTFTDFGQFAPAVAMDADGDFAITWTSNHQDTFFSSVYSQRFSASGVKLGAEVHVNTGTQGEFYPVISMDADGDYVIAWTSFGRDGSDHAVYAQRFNAAGVRQGAEFLVNTHTPGDQEYPAVAMDGDGEFVIAWHSYGQVDASDVFAQRFDASGARQGSEFRVNLSTYGNQWSPSAAMDAEGNFVVSWNGNGDLGGGVYARRFDAAATPLGGDFRVRSVHATGIASTVAMDADGDFVVAWESYLHPQDGSYASVHSQRFTTFGAGSAGSLGDRVWNDANASGIQDAGEPGIAGAAIELRNSSGVLVGTTTTGAAGHYSFVGMAGATAYVQFVAPAGLIFTRQNQGGNDELDSNVDQLAGRTPAFTIGAGGTNNTSIDAGLVPPSSVGGVVFNDRNGSGARDAGEEALAMFRVFLDLDNDSVRDVDEPAADVSASGNYSFTSVLSGAYRIVAFDQDLWAETVLPPVAIPPGAATQYDVPVRTSVPDKAATPQGAEFRINTFTTGDQHTSSIAIDANGNFVVAWSGSGQGDDAGIFAQRYNASGIKQGSEFRVNSHTTGSQHDPSAAMDSDGDFVVTWTTDGQDGGAGGIYAQRYTAAGVKQGSEFLVNTYTTGNQTSSAAAMDASGDFLVVWQSYGQDGSQWGTYAQRYNASGVVQGSEFRVNTSTDLSEGTPSVAMDASGNFVVAWGKGPLNSEVPSNDIYAQRFDAFGVAQGGDFRVSTATDSSDVTPTVAMDADGDFVVAWASGGHGYYGYAVFDVYAQRYNALGVAQGTAFRVNAITGAAAEPSAAMNADGDLVIAWHGDGISARRYNAAGLQQGAELQVNSNTTGSKDLAAAAINAAGDFVIAWTSAGQDGSDWGIYAQQYSVAVRPAVTASQFIWNSGPPRIEFTFDQDISASLTASDLVLKNLTTGATISTNQIVMSWNPTTKTATFTFPTLPNGGSLPDGDYRATLAAGGVANPAGTSLAVDYALDFFFLGGDADHDADVDLDDFNILASNFNQTGRNFSQGDFNYNGNVNLDDFNILAARFNVGTSMPLVSSRLGSDRIIEGIFASDPIV